MTIESECLHGSIGKSIDDIYEITYIAIHKSLVNRRIVSRLVRVISTSRRTVNPTIEHDVVRPDAHVSRRSYAAFTLLIREQFLNSQ